MTPLIGLGLCNSLEEVEYLVSLVDEDGSGEIEFDEFLRIVSNKGHQDSGQKIR